MIVLALETSTQHGSVAVSAFNEIVFEAKFTAERSHSSDLFKALEKARGHSAKFDRLVVGVGPGSYAGVRIGIAAALGMNFALNAELLGIPSAAALDVPEQDYVVIGDARRGTFYFTLVRDGVCYDGPRLVSEREAREAMSNFPVYATEPVGAFPSLDFAQPSARILVQLGITRRSIVQTGDLEPLYLREVHITPPKAGQIRIKPVDLSQFDE